MCPLPARSAAVKGRLSAVRNALRKLDLTVPDVPVIVPEQLREEREIVL